MKENLTKQYFELLEKIKRAIQKERTNAIQQLTRSLIKVYWEIGREINKSQEQNGWGKSVVEHLSKDFRKHFRERQDFQLETFGKCAVFMQRIIIFQICNKLLQKFRGVIIY